MLEAVDAPPRPDDGLLHGVFRIETRAEHAIAVSGELPAMLLQVLRPYLGVDRHGRPSYRDAATPGLPLRSRGRFLGRSWARPHGGFAITARGATPRNPPLCRGRRRAAVVQALPARGATPRNPPLCRGRPRARGSRSGSLSLTTGVWRVALPAEPGSTLRAARLARAQLNAVHSPSLLLWRCPDPRPVLPRRRRGAFRRRPPRRGRVRRG